MDIPQQKQFKILLIGDNCKDVYRFGTVDRISPEAPVPIFKFSHDESKPGMAANVQLNLESLGCEVVPCFGQESTKIRFIDIRSKQHIMRSDWDVVDLPLLLKDIPHDLTDFDAIVISDYEKGYVSYELIDGLRTSFDGPIFIDTKKTSLSNLAGCYLKINQLEASRVVSLPEPEFVIITMGGNGAFWNGQTFKAKEVEVADVCGAGDTFLSALTYQYLNNNDMNSAIEFAIRASSLTVQHFGNYAPALGEINVS